MKKVLSIAVLSVIFLMGYSTVAFAIEAEKETRAGEPKPKKPIQPPKPPKKPKQ